MKAYSFENWTKGKGTEGLMFFVQNVEEMLFHYSHDSYKVPALNFHYLCEEILQCIGYLEREIVDKGNMRPLVDEMSAMLQGDIIAQILYGDKIEDLFYLKNEKGQLEDNYHLIENEPGSENSVRKLRKIISYLLEDMEIQNKYFELTKLEIKTAVLQNSDDEERRHRLAQLSRLFLTELINRGYSQEYIYREVIKRFYTESRIIENPESEIEEFLGLFTFKRHKYTVTLPFKRRDTAKFLSRLDHIEVIKNEERLFKGAFPYLAKIKVQELDPVGAGDSALGLIDLVLSLQQFNTHKRNTFPTNKAQVQEENNTAIYINKPVNVMERGRAKSELKTNEFLTGVFGSNKAVNQKILRAITLHSSAMDTKVPSDQLLNLWTIIEVIINFDRNAKAAKIIQITNTLTTVLNASYISSLLQQMANDLRRCYPDFENVLGSVDYGKTDIEKMAAVLVLGECTEIRSDLMEGIKAYPLLQYRMNHYAAIFSDRQKLKTYLENHRRRVGWQISRIYRNRNLIIHDGVSMTYLELLIGNLHFYTDTLLETISYCHLIGYDSVEAIFAHLNHVEHEREILLSKGKEEKIDGKKVFIPDPITTDDFVDVVLGKCWIS